MSPRDHSGDSVVEEEEEEEEGEEGESGGSVCGEDGGMVTMMVGDGVGKREEEEVESDGCTGGCGGGMFFSVGEVRRRLSHHVTAPRKTFRRDPEDPSGTVQIMRNLTRVFFTLVSD